MTPPRRPVPAATAVLTVAVVAVVATVVVLIAGLAGPLVAHPPTVAPEPPPALAGPTLPPVSTSTPPPRQQEPPSVDWLWWALAVLGGLIVLALVAWLIRALRRPARPAPGAVGTAPGPRLDAVIGALAEQPTVDLGDERTFDARRAADDIIASWSAVERAAAIIGRPRPGASTPTEFLASLTAECGDPRLDSGRSAAEVLLTLYHHARFDTAVLAPGSATDARTAARTLLGAVQPRTPGPGAHR